MHWILNEVRQLNRIVTLNRQIKVRSRDAIKNHSDSASKHLKWAVRIYMKTVTNKGAFTLRAHRRAAALANP